MKNYESLKNEDAMKTWVYRITVNESLSLIKERKKVVLTPEDGQAELPYEEKSFEPKADLYEHINKLERDVQDIIKLRFYEELSLLEISQVMEMNLNTVKAKLYRGLKSLKVMIREVDL